MHLKRNFFLLLGWVALGSAGTVEAQSSGAKPFPRVAVAHGHFTVKETGAEYVPVGANFFHVATLGDQHEVHATFCPGVYNAGWVDKMMADLAAHGLNTVRTFQVYAVGAQGILVSREAREISPAYLGNVLHFLRAARTNGIHVIFTWDSWLPDSVWWSTQTLPDEAKYSFNARADPADGTNNFLLTLAGARTRANAIVALIQAIRKADPSLLPVVLAWELQNEVGFDQRYEPFKSRPTGFHFAGKSYDLGSDAGAQQLMDDALVQWSDFCTEQIHRADPEALAGVSVFTFAAVSRAGPANLSKDVTTDSRLPGRALALVRSKLDYADLHVYAWSRPGLTFEEHLAADLASSEMPVLRQEAVRLQKPLLVGETGVPTQLLPGTSQKDGTSFPFDYHLGIPVLQNLCTSLKTAGFVGALYWHYGIEPATPKDDFPVLTTFPEYDDVLTAVWPAGHSAGR